MSEPGSARGPSLLTIPEGYTRERKVCPDCGFIAYENPKIVVGAVCRWDERILLCHRAIDPQTQQPGRRGAGKQCLPAGECLVLLLDQFPGYITWQRFQANQQKIQENRATQATRARRA